MNRVPGAGGKGQEAGGALVELKGLSKAYRTPAGDIRTLSDINLRVRQGEFLAVVGKSGAGKSTLVNMVTGIDRPTAGEILIGGQAIHRLSEDQLAAWRGRTVGVVFQSFQLLPMLTCAQNVMLPMDFAGRYSSPRERHTRALALLERVGIADQADKLPSAVSGGQRQRVAIARALANDPVLLAADEPTGNLDSRTAAAVFEVFERLADEGKTVLMVTHDRELAARTHRIVHLVDGRITEATETEAAERRPDA
jgi:ABC-type lipoprotein export system ATPase subunit